MNAPDSARSKSHCDGFFETPDSARRGILTRRNPRDLTRAHAVSDRMRVSLLDTDAGMAFKARAPLESLAAFRATVWLLTRTDPRMGFPNLKT